MGMQMHVCSSQSTYSCDMLMKSIYSCGMLMKCMLMPKKVLFFFNNGVMIKIVMDLLLYTSRGECKGRKHSPFCVLI